MWKILRSIVCICAALFCAASPAQTTSATSAITFEGLRLSANKGSFKAAQYAPDGSLVLLYDQGDGLRLLKTDAQATALQAQAQAGFTGDDGIALTLDAQGNAYVVGTSTSGKLTGTGAVPFPQPADSTTNSFLAKFDPNLNLVFLTFLGAGKTAASGVAATSDAVFVTGTTYGGSVPVTTGSFGQHPASGTAGSGFVERFSTDGKTLAYATYLTGSSDETSPAAIAADATDAVYVAGETSAADFPTLAALQPTLLGANAGFLTKLTPAGDALVFSSFIPGLGITGLTIDSASSTLLLTGNIAIGQFPIASVAGPVASTPYQALLRISEDGQTVPESVLLAPGTASFVTAGPNGTAWVSGSLGTPLLPSAPSLPSVGDSFLFHIGQTGTVDQSFRLGGLPVTNFAFASLTSSTGPPAVSPEGLTIVVPATVTATASASLSAAERFDLPLVGPANNALPSGPGDLLPSTCSGLSNCTGSGGLLAEISLGATQTSLSLATGDLPNILLRNTGSVAAINLAFTTSGYMPSTSCGGTLLPSAECLIALSGTGPGTLSVSAANAAESTVSLPSSTAVADTIALSASELDFGIVTPLATVSRTVTVTNLSGTTQTFPSLADGLPPAPGYTLAETASTCGGTAAGHTIAANGSCTVTLSLGVASAATTYGPVRVAWTLGTRDVGVTGITQATAVSVSAAEIDFGTHLLGVTPSMPRYLYLSNSSSMPVTHTPVALPANSPFTVLDNCPSILEGNSVCQISLTYKQAAAPSADSATLTLDGGLTVLVTGDTLEPFPADLSKASLTVSPSSYSFASPVVATGISFNLSEFVVTNTGSAPVPVNAAITGDFLLSNACGATLNAGASCVVSVAFAPSQPGVREGFLLLTSGTGFAGVEVQLSGTGAALLPENNGTLALGSSPVGEPAVAWYKVGASMANLTAISSSAAFGVALVEDTGTGHGTLAASGFSQTTSATCHNCWLGVQFFPQTSGLAAATLTLSSQTGGNPYQLSLTGTGISVSGLVLTPAAQDFGTVAVGSSSAPLTLTLANLLAPASGATIEAVSVTGDFHLAANTSGGPSCAGVLASTASCFLRLSFTPTLPGARAGILTVTTSAGSATATLTGSAIANTGIAISPSSLNFSDAEGISSTQTITLTNTGSAAIAIGIPTATASFSATSACAVLEPGTTCNMRVSFTPGASEVNGMLTLPVTSTAVGQAPPTVYTVPLTANYSSSEVGLLLLPAQVDFGPQATGTLGQTRQFTLTNTSGSPQAITLSAPQHFPLSAPSSCGTLAAGESCTFSISFLPESGGMLTGTVTASTTTATGTGATTQANLAGYGIATGALSITSSSQPSLPVNFGNISSGQTAQQILTLTNTGADPLAIRRLSTNSPFAATTTCETALSSGASCTVAITYAPIYELSTAATSMAPRDDTGTLTIESDARSSADEVPMIGTALPLTSAAPASAPAPPTYALSQAALTFANTQVGDLSQSQTVLATNTGSSTITFTVVQAPADYQATTTCTTLAPSASCTITVIFAPGAENSASLRAATLAVQSNATDPLNFISLLGLSSPSPLTLSPGSLDFGTVQVGTNDQLSVTATNAASLPITFGQLSATGDYSVAAGTCPGAGGSLPSGQSCSMVLSFAPSETGTRTGVLSVPSDATSTPLTVSLTGASIASKLQVSPGALAFGSLTVGASGAMPLKLLNAGSATLAFVSAVLGGADPSDFAITTPCASTTLAPVAGCTMQVTFTPSALGSRTATLSIASSDPSGPAVIALSGTGTQAGGFALTVNGAKSSTMNVASGSAAAYALLVTPQGNYTGSLVLTCTPISPAPYAACSLRNSQLTLGSGAQAATATITTISAVSSESFSWLFLLAPLGIPLCRRRGRRWHGLRSMLLLAGVAALCGSLVACAGPANTGNNMTPAGTYRYQVTASSTSGVQLASTVTLNLTVQ